jgi:hypothetical protein
MVSTNLWHRFPLFSRKTLISSLLLLLIPAGLAFGQGKNNPLYDYNKRLHFGFTIGTNVAGFSHEFSDDFRRNDSLLGIEKQNFPGITLGAIANLHLGEHFDLRLIPTLALSERAVKFRFSDRPNVEKNIESVFIEAPLTFKFKSVRHDNTRFYVIGGGKISYDMSSKANTEQNPFDPFLAVKPRSFYYEFGFGFDFYFPYFKFSPELKISRGLTDVLSKDRFVFSESFSSLRSNVIFLSLHFE